MSARKGADLGVTASSTGAPTPTIGAGLPGFGGRLAGDTHYNTTDGRMYVLTGVAGASATDSFNRADGSLSGQNTETGGLAYAQLAGYGYAQIVSQKLHFDAGSVSGGVALNPGAVNHEIGADVSGWTGSVNVPTFAVRGSAGFGFSAGTCYQVLVTTTQVLIRKGWGGTTMVTVTTTTGNATYRVNVDSSTTAPTITVYRNNVAVASYTDSSGSPYNGTWLGLQGGGNGTLGTDKFDLDNLTVVSPGTLAWTPQDPIFLYGFVPGVQAVANNVLKPGLRVPAPTRLRTLTARIDTAPVGSALTYAVERFVNGVSQGVIGTVSIAAGATSAQTTGLSASLTAEDILKINTTAVGSGTPGSDALLSLDLW